MLPDSTRRWIHNHPRSMGHDKVQLSQKKKKKKIHNTETHIWELQSPINMNKIVVLVTIMDIAV